MRSRYHEDFMKLIPMEMKHKHPPAFSLVEVVLAVGVVSIAMVAIFGMFSVSMQSNSDVISQYESFAVTRALPAFLSGTSAGYATVYAWVSNTATAPRLYAYNILNTGSTSQTLIVSGTDLNLNHSTTGYQKRLGRLYQIFLSVSPNMPIVTGSGTLTYAQNPTAYLGTSPSTFTEAVLPVQARVYTVSGLKPPAAWQVPALTFDVAVPRY